MDIGKGVGPTDVVQKSADVDELGKKVVIPQDPFKLTQEVFMKGFLANGQRFKLSEKEMKKYWYAIANGKLELSKDDFSLVNIHEALRELQGSSDVLMATFVKLINLYLSDKGGDE